MKKIFVIGIMTAFCLCAMACGSAASEEKSEEERTEETDKKVDEETETTEEKTYDSSAAFVKYQEHNEILLWENKSDMPYAEEGLDSLNPTITPYVAQEDTSGGCVIICPGGGYVQLSREKEGSEIAAALNENNITAFVLEYRTKPYEGNAAMADVFRAIRYVRYNAEEFGINPDKIAIMGFSAGGHLATMALQHYEEDEQQFDEVDEVSAEPNLGILCYPVVTFKDGETHETTRQAFLGADNVTNEELIKKYSGEEQVTKNMAPVFMWCCEGDALVSNTKLLEAALNEAGVSNEVHIYPKGKHGIGLGTGYGEAEQWFQTCVEWLKNNDF